VVEVSGQMSRQPTSSVKNVLPIALGLLLAAPGLSAEERPVLELSLEDAVARALENNVDIVVERFGPLAADQSIIQAEGRYDPSVTALLYYNDTTSPQSNAFSGGEEVNTASFIYNFGASQAIKTGGELSIGFDNRRQDTDSIFSTFNPSYSVDLTAQFTQPLLANLKIDVGRNQIRVSKKNREISDVQFRQQVINIRSDVQKSYYDVIATIDNLEAARKSLDLAKKLLEENEIKVRVGTLAPLDVVEAQYEVAAREEEVITAEGLLEDAQDALKRRIFPEYDRAAWSSRLVPTDRYEAQPFQVDIEQALSRALEERTDLVAARMGVETTVYELELARNQQLPSLDLIATYGGAGVGGTSLVREGFGGPVIEEIEGGYGDAVSDALGLKYPTWAVGVQFSLPIRNRQAEAVTARAVIARDQRQAIVRRLELQIATEVRTAGRAVDTNFKRVESTRAARVLSERRLDAEQKKFAAGMSTSFLVTQAQRDLAVAEVSQLRAELDFRKSVIEFERVQEAGLGGSGSVLSVTAGGLQGLLASSGAASQGTSAPSPQ
jgi:outer membrane protein